MSYVHFCATIIKLTNRLSPEKLMKIRIWGARGSTPSPIKPDAIEEKITQAILQMPPIDTIDEAAVRAYVQSLPQLMRGTAGGNTPCVEIQAGREIFIMDAGSGLRELGLELMKGSCGRGEGVIHLFFSHPHWDHIQGFPFFAPAFVPGNKLYIYSVHNVKKALENQQHSLTFPVSLEYMQAHREFITLEAGVPFLVGPLTINTAPNAHPGVSYSYRFEDKHSVFVYASDAEYKNLDADSIRPYLDFFRNADLLVFDAQYTLKEAWQKVDWGHSSAMIGVDMARSAGVKRLLLFHHDPTYSDADLIQIQKTAEAYQSHDTVRAPCKIIVAHEGYSIDLAPPGLIDVQVTSEQDAAVLTPAGSFTQQGVVLLENQLLQFVEQDTHTIPIIDLSQIETLSVAGLKALLTLHRKKSGSQIVLANPSQNTREIIELSGYRNIFAIYPSIDAALTAVKTRETLNLPGQLIDDRYRIEQKIGESPLGTVLKATDTRTGETVALKILSPFFGTDTIAKFLRLAEPLKQLAHPHIVRLLDYSRTETYTYLVEAFVENETLQTRLDDAAHPLSHAEITTVVHQLADALAYAHSFGIVHGDLKPRNIFITPAGIKLSGFGLGHLDEGNNLRVAPLLLLNASYLAPEQIYGAPIDVRTDLYTLGVLLYQLFTGELPFSGSEQEVLQAHIEQAPPPPRSLNAELSPLLEHLILKLLAKHPDGRYQTIQAVQGIWQSICAVNKTHVSTVLPRKKIQRKLASLWKTTQSGTGQFVTITGDAGAGKSATIRQFIAAQSPAIVLTSKTQPTAQSLPYAPFADVFCTYLNAHPTVTDDPQVQTWLATIAPIFPACPPQIAVGTVPPLSSGAAVQQFLRDVVRFVTHETRKQPWVAVLEDIHRTDRATLDLLYHLVRHLADAQVMIVASYRPSALSADHPLPRFLARLAAHGVHPTTIELRGFKQPGVKKLLAQIFSDAIPGVWQKKIWRHTAGNPLYVEEIARGLIDDGHAMWQQGKWQFADADSIRFPQSLREAIWRRLHHLDPDTQTLLRQSAVWGETFQLDELQTVSGLFAAEVLNQLDDALARQLVFETLKLGTFAHHHSEVQQVLYADIGASRRLLLHRQIAAALERKPATPVQAVQLAYHYIHADIPEKAIVYCMQAAEQALAMYAPKVALRWYNDALSMLNQLSPQTLAEYQTYQNTIHRMLGRVLTEFQEFDEILEEKMSKYKD